MWCRIRNVAGTSAEAYTSFIEHVLDAYPNPNPGDVRTLIRDNLTAHTSPMAWEAVRRRGHRCICRPPYRPHDGPVEFAINQACERLEKHWAKVKDAHSMKIVLQEIIDNELTGLNETLIKSGYIWD